MAQKLIQTQIQKQQQLQRLSQQQMLQVKLLEMPLTELEENINAELDDNPALERSSDEEFADNTMDSNGDDYENEEEDSYEKKTEKEEREDALDSALESLGQDDQMPEYNTSRSNIQNADYEEMVYGDTTSFYDKLNEQMDMLELTDLQHDIMEYLIGSLDDDGILRKDLESISDELAIYHNIDADVNDIEHILHLLQNFDPAGIGARSLQECLLLQIDRMPRGRLKEAMQTVIKDYFEEFTKKHWEKIQTGMGLNDIQIQEISIRLHQTLLSILLMMVASVLPLIMVEYQN